MYVNIELFRILALRQITCRSLRCSR